MMMNQLARDDDEPTRSRRKTSFNIELERFGTDWTKPIAKPATKTEHIELTPGNSDHLDNYSAVWHKKIFFSPERQKVIEEEVNKLVDAGFIEEVQFPEWLENVIVVKKENGKWRMCVDYTNLNKTCPKDHYPLPNIDQLIDATAGYSILSFLDAFLGYHQIIMAEEDICRTSFIIHHGTWAYIKMPFGLLKAGATY
ncbi:hypothetical protein AgCh_001612 [Apium graveolens]